MYLSLMPTKDLLVRLSEMGIVRELTVYGHVGDLTWAWVDVESGMQHAHDDLQARRCALKHQPEVDRMTAS